MDGSKHARTEEGVAMSDDPLHKLFDDVNESLFQLSTELERRGIEWWHEIYGMRVKCGQIKQNKYVVASIKGPKP